MTDTHPTPDTVCICGHPFDEHGKGSADGCYTRDCDCKEFEPDSDDEWDGDEDRE